MKSLKDDMGKEFAWNELDLFWVRKEPTSPGDYIISIAVVAGGEVHVERMEYVSETSAEAAYGVFTSFCS